MKSQSKHLSRRSLRIGLVFGAAVISFAGLRWGEEQGSGLGAPAEAFSYVGGFATGAEMGGGGGRYFTGSPRDGFTCGVCHQSERFFDIELQGFPEKIKPGQTYDLRFTWEGEATRVHFNAEIVNAKGVSAGELVVGADEKNAPKSVSTEDDREVLAVMGSSKRSKSEVAFKWKASAELSGPVTVHIAGVRQQEKDKSSKGDQQNPLENDELALYTAQIAVAGGSSASKPPKTKDSKDD